MKKSLITLTLLFLIAGFCNAQNQPVPDYVTKQQFPDSVSQMQLTTTTGAKVTLEEILKKHQGKKVFLDFWASWCKDCLAGMPDLKKLISKTDGKVDYVFLSLDRNEEQWLSALEKYELVGDHYWLNQGWKNELTNYINLDWIPRYLILDEEGNVIMPKAIEAKDKRVEALLLK
ncbi:TlpA family protein disulfide reductase [Fulvivirga sediminis]|uniref:Redoxin family protein n=1 Tax=Fulvivirga sediminis TaxID=2803949 RepID=A0A937K078_9BACT|nr:TlpA disulfide reductase family protein [Fulvivirga sediminis]MBL3655227.1 redoxin family protein [Fulvivirga sediminis]